MNLQETMKDLFGHSCLGYCYAFMFGNTMDYKVLTGYFLDGWFNGFIDDDGYISKPVEYIRMIGETKVKDIRKVKISSLEELPNMERYVVEYANPNGGSHFVVVNNKVVEFDPSYPSLSVKNGKIISYREIVY